MYNSTLVSEFEFEMYVYRTWLETVVEALMVEHFGVHCKGHKPTPTPGREWNKIC